MPDTDSTSDPPVKPRKRRRLRVAWSVFFGVLTVALCVLWVRSYWRQDDLAFITPNSMAVEIESSCGYLMGFVVHDSSGLTVPKTYRNSKALPSKPTSAHQQRFGWNVGASVTRLGFPDWFLSAIFAALAALPWLSHLPFRFSLRTMLIATTLIAVALGLLTWSLSK